MKLLTLLALISALSLTACTEKTPYGPCIGAFDDKDAKKVYHVNTTNVVVGIIFSETIIVPAVVVLDETLCPVSDK